MSSNFGYIDVVLLALFAGFILLRLRNILGRRTGHEIKPNNHRKSKIFQDLHDESNDKTHNKINDKMIGSVDPVRLVQFG